MFIYLFRDQISQYFLWAKGSDCFMSKMYHPITFYLFTLDFLFQRNPSSISFPTQGRPTGVSVAESYLLIPNCCLVGDISAIYRWRPHLMVAGSAAQSWESHGTGHFLQGEGRGLTMAGGATQVLPQQEDEKVIKCWRVGGGGGNSFEVVWMWNTSFEGVRKTSPPHKRFYPVKSFRPMISQLYRSLSGVGGRPPPHTRLVTSMY